MEEQKYFLGVGMEYFLEANSLIMIITKTNNLEKKAAV